MTLQNLQFIVYISWKSYWHPHDLFHNITCFLICHSFSDIFSLQNRNSAWNIFCEIYASYKLFTCLRGSFLETNSYSFSLTVFRVYKRKKLTLITKLHMCGILKCYSCHIGLLGAYISQVYKMANCESLRV